MPILPFIDRPEVNLYAQYSMPSISSSGTLGAPSVEQFKQGISVKTSADVFRKLTPFMSSNGFPFNVRDAIDYSVLKLNYGPIDLFKESDNDITIAPFDDISSLNDPVKYLKDTGITAYPNVMLSPNWLNPGSMSGIIEPLSVRGLLAGATNESPFVAHTIRASMMKTPKSYRVFMGTAGNYNKDTAFIDSSDVVMQNDKIRVPGQLIGDFGESQVLPFDESMFTTIKNDLKEFAESDFNDFTGVGIISRGVSTMFSFESKNAVEKGKTGIRNTTGIDSIAFGGQQR